MTASAALSGEELRLALGGLGLEVGLATPTNGLRPARGAGDLCFVSSMTPIVGDGTEIRGRLGVDRSLAEGCEAARWAMANSLAWLAAEVGDSDRRRWWDAVDLLVFRNAGLSYGDHSLVADSASELLAEVFDGTIGHARGASGRRRLSCEIQLSWSRQPTCLSRQGRRRSDQGLELNQTSGRRDQHVRSASACRTECLVRERQSLLIGRSQRSQRHAGRSPTPTTRTASTYWERQDAPLGWLRPTRGAARDRAAPARRRGRSESTTEWRTM